MIVKSPLCIRAQATEQVVEKKETIFNRNGGLHSIPFPFYIGFEVYWSFIRVLTIKVQIFWDGRKILNKKEINFFDLTKQCQILWETFYQIFGLLRIFEL